MSATIHDPLDEIVSIAREIELVVFDFDGVFTDNRVLVLQDGTEGVLCSRSDGFGLEALGKRGIRAFVLSKEVNPVVTVRCKKLNILCIQGCDEKERVLRNEARRLDVPLSKVAYLGNDINDLECLKIVGLPACVADSYPEVIDVSMYITAKEGGYGAVREFCDYIVAVKDGRLL